MGSKQSTNNMDISSYLTQKKADEIYQVKPPSHDEFVLKSYADNTYKFPENYATKDELSAYLLEDKAKNIFQELPPKGDQFVLKSYTDQLNKLTSNYVTITELNKYLTQELATSLYQPKGNYLTKDSNDNIRNNGTNYLIKGADQNGNNYFTINNANGVTSWSGQPVVFNSFVNSAAGINSYGDIITVNKNNYMVRDVDDNFMNSTNFQKKRPGGVKNGNELGYITFEGTDTDKNMKRGALIISTTEGDFTSTSSPANIKFSTTSPGSTSPTDKVIIKPSGRLGIGTNDPQTLLDVNGVIWNRSTDFMLGINDSRGNFNNNMLGGRALVKDANSQLVLNYANDFGGGVRVDSNMIQKYGTSVIIPDSGGSYGSGNGSYIYNDGQTLKIQMRNGGDGRIELKAGSKTLSFDKDGKLCFGPGKCITENTPGIIWSS